MEHEESGGLDTPGARWVVSCADFITLLSALLVLVCAVSMQWSDQVDHIWTPVATTLGGWSHRVDARRDAGKTARGLNGHVEVAVRAPQSDSK